MVGLLSDYFLSWVWWARSIGFDPNPCKFWGFFEDRPPVCFSLSLRLCRFWKISGLPGGLWLGLWGDCLFFWIFEFYTFYCFILIKYTRQLHIQILKINLINPNIRHRNLKFLTNNSKILNSPFDFPIILLISF